MSVLIPVITGHSGCGDIPIIQFKDEKSNWQHEAWLKRLPRHEKNRRKKADLIAETTGSAQNTQ